MTQNATDRSWFTEWREPEVFFRAADDSQIAIETEKYFNQARFGYLTEAWCAGEFAAMLNRSGNSVQIRLGADQNAPDFSLLVTTDEGTKEQHFELAEIMHPDRRRGQEYRRGSRRIAGSPSNQLTSEVFYRQLQVISDKKIKKKYKEQRHLLLSCHTTVFELLGESSNPIGMVNACESATSAFHSVWVRVNEKCYRVFPKLANGNIIVVS
jgi:hypothetical protein